MIDGYARVSTDGQSGAAQVDALTHAAAATVNVASAPASSPATNC